jgi:hypothetical protein
MTSGIPWESVRKVPRADHRKLVRRWKNGESYSQIGKTYSVSKARVEQIVNKMLRRKKAKVKAYLFRRYIRGQTWTPKMQMIEFEMMRGEG